MATFPIRSKINISMLVMKMKNNSWMEKLRGSRRAIIKVGTIKRLKVIND
jgi:hypothetical protein